MIRVEDLRFKAIQLQATAKIATEDAAQSLDSHPEDSRELTWCATACKLASDKIEEIIKEHEDDPGQLGSLYKQIAEEAYKQDSMGFIVQEVRMGRRTYNILCAVVDGEVKEVLGFPIVIEGQDGWEVILENES